MTWTVIRPKYEDGVIHVIPEDDLRPHYTNLLCWCEPTLDDDDLIAIHNAMDQRETYEQGRKKS